MARLAREMSIPQAAEWLGMNERTLRRRIERLEAKFQRQVFPRSGDGKRQRVVLTEPVLRKYFRHWFSWRDEITAKATELADKREEAIMKRLVEFDTRLDGQLGMIVELQTLLGASHSDD